MLGLLAVIWMALYAPRRQLLGVLAGYAGVWALPLVFAAGTADPGLRWSTAALAVATAAIAGATVQSLVASVRRHADELEQRDRERTRLLARVETLAQTDALTGLPNRRAWDAQLQRERADRRGRDFCIAALDLDHFKELNDAEGHAAGDRALRTCAATWEAQLRPHDILARIGGDEFSVLLADCALAEAVEIIERLRGATPAPLTCSAGVAHRCEGESSSALQARADAVLYAAKRTGRARTASAEPAGA
jgi:diguanylate cyclase (GGDEF)-like protein